MLSHHFRVFIQQRCQASRSARLVANGGRSEKLICAPHRTLVRDCGVFLSRSRSNHIILSQIGLAATRSIVVHGSPICCECAPLKVAAV